MLCAEMWRTACALALLLAACNTATAQCTYVREPKKERHWRTAHTTYTYITQSHDYAPTRVPNLYSHTAERLGNMKSHHEHHDRSTIDRESRSGKPGVNP